ncbi:MAG: hypothetical protein CME71_04185 [Halobacteriovorax sp.]|nr:hypothetical protein [Halobacteriovorax sp.]
MKILILLCLFPALAWSKLDYSSQNLLRTYPMGLFASGTVGYSFKTWDKSDVNPALYGYVRPSATIQTSGPVNQVRAQLDIAPVAFANFYGGTAIVNRDYNDLDTFNCDTVICRAKMFRQYVGFKMALKFKSIFLVTDHRFERVKVSEKRGVFAEEMGTLLGAGSDDVLRVNQLIVGVDLNEKWSAGGMVVANAMEKFTNSSRMQLGFVRRQLGKWNILAGAGTFHTRTNSDVFTTLFLFQWSGERGLTLF